jgi:hypothetical protein
MKGSYYWAEIPREEKPKITLKASRREQPVAAQPPAKGPYQPSRYVYRFLERREHAEAFVRGEIWVSTLEHIRHCDAARADPHEGTVKFGISRLDHNTPPAQAGVIRERLKEHFVELPPTLSITGISFESAHADSFVLCTTEQRSPMMKRLFGAHCVQIENPERFAGLLAHAIEARVPLSGGFIRNMDYEGRTFNDAEGIVSHPAFMNVGGNREECEVRMLFIPTDATLAKPMLVICPEAGSHCALLSA